MLQTRRSAVVLSIGFWLALTASAAVRRPVPRINIGALWTEPRDISRRDLFYGPGGKAHEPHGPYTFEKEDLDGTNPKFVVHDAAGVKWKVKLGEEARPETVATRLVWSVGYYTNEDYFLPEIRVRNLPPKLKRGQSLVRPGGVFNSVRLKRESHGEKKAGIWKWRSNPFNGTRQLDGLRVMMALINNWDLKDINNAVYREKSRNETVYMISDLGASFGTNNLTGTHQVAKGNLRSYERSEFIVKVTPAYVTFRTPSRPSLKYLIVPKEYFSRINMEWIGKRIPREHVRWIGRQLGQLSSKQIHDAFRAAGYSAAEANAFSNILSNRIAEIRSL